MTTPAALPRATALIAEDEPLLAAALQADLAAVWPQLQVVATVGEVHASPNSRNVIAGDVQFTIDVRGWDEAATDHVCQRIEAALAEAALQAGCEVAQERIWQVSRVPFDQRLRSMVGEAATDLQELFARHGYTVAPLLGHARDGNLHFVFWQDFGAPAEVARYKGFMEDFCKLVTEKYDGSLKAEHGTGRNIAPFVELEWGSQAYAIMKSIKGLLDPKNILNPGVLLNSDSQGHLKNLKPLHPADELVDKCMECGFCESVCPSRDLTLTPRQRITVYREICRLRANDPGSSELKTLQKGYEYMGKATCATDSLCRPRCPAGVDTGVFIKSLRKKDAGSLSKNIAGAIADHFAGTCKAMSIALNSVDTLHRMLGTTIMRDGSRLLRCLSFNKIPMWNKNMPKGGRSVFLPSPYTGNAKKVVYFPSCIARNMGPGEEHSDRRPEPEAVISVLLKGGYDVILPNNLDKLCCGMAFASKGLADAAHKKEQELEKVHFYEF